MLNRFTVIAGLGYAGLLPFLIPVYLLITGSVLPAEDAVTLFLSYSTVILAFLGGSLWGYGLARSHSFLNGFLLVGSNLVALLAWAGLLLGFFSPHSAVAGLSAGFVLVLLFELRFTCFMFAESNAAVKNSYIDLRLTLTAIVILAHLLVFYYMP
jgi:hypothetical protein